MDEFNGAVTLDQQIRADLYLDQALHSNALAAQAAEIGKSYILMITVFGEVVEDDNNFNTIFKALDNLSKNFWS